MKKLLLFSLLLFTCCGVLPLLGTVSQTAAKPTAATVTAEPIGTSTVIASGDPVRRFLLLGCDRAASLTDTILVAALNTATGDVRVLQLPRDTYANYTARDYRKLNGALNALDLGGLKQFLSRALGVRIHTVAAIDLEGVASLVDAVGGVDVEIPQDMDYSDPAQHLEIHLRCGMTHLNGKDAESFVRFRSGYVNGDLGRVDAQRAFLRAFAAKCAGFTEQEFAKLFFAVLPHLQTDLPIQEAISLSGTLHGAHLSEIPMKTAPGKAAQGSSGAWYYSVNRAGMIRTINELLMPPEPIGEGNFDPDRVFDCTGNPTFHSIYLAPDPGD